MKVLIIDKDGVLNPEAFMTAVKWGFLNISPLIMAKILYGYLILKKINAADMARLEKFFAANAAKLAPASETVSAMLKLRRQYDYVIMLTNNGTNAAANIRIHDELSQYYPSGTFDEVIIQPVGHSKEEIYKKWVDAGHDVTVIDDSRKHIADALRVGAKNVVGIGKKAAKDIESNISLSEYAYKIMAKSND